MSCGREATVAPMHAAFDADRRRTEAAQSALTLCAGVDALARDAETAVARDDDALLSLLEQRDVMLQDLAEQLAVLRLERPTADSAWLRTTERVVDGAEALVDEVLAAVSTSQRITAQLTARIARRAEELRAELDVVQRASTASSAYGLGGGARQVDRRR